MKKLFLTCSILIFTKNFAQNINNSEFNNVIEIECSRDFGFDKNTKCFDLYSYKKPIFQGDLLVDVALPSSEKIPVISFLPEIPPSWFSFLFPEFSEIIFITPNHELNRQRENKKGEPPVSSIIYHIKRHKNTKQPIVEKRVISDDYPKMTYNETDFGKYQENGKIKVYYSEIETQESKNAVKSFENQFKKKISFYKKTNDKAVYYTLEGLTKNEKLAFVLNRSKANKSTQLIENQTISIFTPYFIEK